MAVILPSVYKDGTATVAAGGVVVTGQNTLWLKSLLPGDFFGVHKGFAVRIVSVDSNTQLTLANAWPGAAQAAAAYEIMLQSDVARYSEALRQLLEKLSSGNVDALAGLVGAANKFPFFNGAGTMDVGDVSPFARSNVLNKTDRSGLLSGIGVSDSVSALATLVTDLDFGRSDGWVSGASGSTNNLPMAGQWIVNVKAWSNGAFVLQTAYQAFGTGSPRRQFTRQRNNDGVWTLWVEQASNALLGPASQSGGVPTGAIIERGSNANGDYVRFADGTQICSRTFTDVVSVTSLFGTWYYGSAAAWTFPAPFSTASFAFSGSCRASGSIIAMVGGDHASNYAGAFYVSSASIASASIATKQMAIGRWF